MTDTSLVNSQRVNDAEHIGLVSVGPINNVVGATATVLTRPTAGTGPYLETPRTLFIQVEQGTFRFQIGDQHLTLTYTQPPATVSDGSGSLLLVPGILPFAFTSMSLCTVVGSSATDILTYWWV